jgi:rubrerythrin
MDVISNERGIDFGHCGKMPYALKLARSPERFECESLFPIVIQDAEVKNLPHAAMEFSQMKEVYAPHWELFDDAVDNLGNTPKVNYWVHPACEYIVTSDTTGQCPIF